MTDELHYASLTELAGRIRTGRTTSLEVVEACLARIAAVDSDINAVVALDADEARAAARRADDHLRQGADLGPLHGLPFTAKDSLDTAGLTTTAGTTGWMTRVPDRDATVVARLRAAGAILLGKTNTPEFTWSNETDNLIYGRTSNPYDLERTPGGSSGGPAAAVAAGCSPLDIGSDTGDSIRQPAHVCGIAGLKPTSGRVPRTGHWPAYHGILQSLTQLGPMARAVDDLALVLPIIAGPDGEDPHVMPVPLRSAADVELAGLRVVVFTDNGVRTPTTETVETVLAASRVFESARVRLSEERPPAIDRLAGLYDPLVGADGHAWLKRLLAAAGTPGAGSYERWLPGSTPLPGDELTALVEELDRTRATLHRWVQDVDLIVSPVMPQPAVRHGETDEPWFDDTYSEVHNLTGWPSGVVRAGTSPEGLPIGVQLVAGPWREDVVVAAARIIEAELGGWQPPPR